MSKHDVLVIGGGISGLTFAHEAARAGRSVLLLEQAPRLGGCLATHQAASGFWYELGAHTCYNSYVGLTQVLDACGLRASVLRRAKTYMRMLDGDRLLPGSNLGMLLRRFSWPELAVHAPRMFTAKKDGQTVYSYYASIVGRRNYGRVLGPMLSAVPSQSADAFPASMLFKARKTRRQDYPRSFTLQGGLASAAEAIGRQPRVEVRLGQAVTSLEAGAQGLSAITVDGARHEADVVALAVTPRSAARVLAGAAPELSQVVARVKEAEVDTLGFAVKAEKVAHLPVSTFLVPQDDVFHSVVTRDPVPDGTWRGFAFHFKPGLDRAGRIERAARLLHVGPTDLEDVAERRSVLPSPVLGHEQIVSEVDRLTAGDRLCLTGNWFAGLSIEDCVDRSRREWARVAALG